MCQVYQKLDVNSECLNAESLLEDNELSRDYIAAYTYTLTVDQEIPFH